MATFLGDVQYSQVMGHLPTPVFPEEPFPPCRAKWRIGHRGGTVQGHVAGTRAEGVGPVHHGVATEGDPVTKQWSYP